MNWERLRDKVIEQNYPGEENLEEIDEMYRKLADFIESEFGVETHFAGSASRATCMKHDRDIDLFLLFDSETERKELEDRGLSIGKKTFKEFDGEYEIEYAEHPYTKGEIDGYEVEIVPAFDVEAEEIKSAVDRTPHHSRWLEKNLTEEERKDVVILKRYLTTEGIYGSSLKVEGFSGYLCEILVSHYGGFMELVEEARSWEENKVIDPEGHHDDLPEELEEKFEDEPLVVIDPVDPERNVASVLSRENLSRFIFLCWNFCNEMGMSFFVEEEEEFTEFEVKQELKRRADTVFLEFDAPEEVDDIVYPQMRKAMRRIRSELEKNDFRMYESGFFIGEKARLFLEVDRQLPEVRKQKGPSVFHGADHMAQFTGKYDNVRVEEDRLVAHTEREYTDAKTLLEEFLSGDLKEKGIPGNIAENISEFSFTDYSGSDEWLNFLGEKLGIQGKQR